MARGRSVTNSQPTSGSKAGRSLFFLCIGTLALWGVIDLVRAVSLAVSGRRAEGVVTQLYFTSAVVQFQTEQVPVETITTNGWTSWGYRVGEKVPVLYSPSNPKTGRVNYFWELYGEALAPLALAIVFIGMWWVMTALRGAMTAPHVRSPMPSEGEVEPDRPSRSDGRGGE
jgi:hypothetical protein